MMKISFSMKMMLKRIMMIMMMTKASEMQLMIPNIKILHLSSSKPKNQAKTQNKHKRNSKCNKQNEKQSKPFSTDQTDKIFEYSLYQVKPIYKIKFKSEAQTSWQDGNQIPKALKDTFHSLYNAKGKKRKRPNKKTF